MGGSAFEGLGLYTPRIPPSTYNYVLRKVKSELADMFMRVEFAIEAPEKKSYGDIDILVVPHPGVPVPSMDEIARRLGAENWLSPSGSSIRHFAIPWPKRIGATDPEDVVLHPAEEVLDSASDDEGSSGSSTPDSKPEPLPNSEVSPLTLPRYIQVDLTILPDEASLHWALFVNAHGDLINILSSIIRRKGLTINNQALYVRIADLEAENRKLARVELSRNATQVLMFLGLDIDQFWRPFTALDEMMRYIATCSFYNPKRSKDMQIDTQAAVSTAVIDNHEKRRTHSRPAFKYWYNTFLPAHDNDPQGSLAHLSREEVLEHCFGFFGQDKKQHYFQRKQEAEIFVVKSRLWSDIRKKILEQQPQIEDDEMQQILKALKREILPNSSSNSTATISSALPQSMDNMNLNSSDIDEQSTNHSSNCNSNSNCESEKETSSHSHSHSRSQTQTHHRLVQPMPMQQQAYLNNDFRIVITWAAENYSTVLAAYRKMVAENGGPPVASFPLDHRKANPFSTTELETYDSEDDRVLATMKKDGRSWVEILAALGKRSKSQLQAHWKEKNSTLYAGAGTGTGTGTGTGGEDGQEI